MINWAYYPICLPPPYLVRTMVTVFEDAVPHIESNGNNLPSNGVLAVIAYADAIIV